MRSEDFTMELLCCEETILNEIEHKEFKRKDVALTYYLCMMSSEKIDWEKVNKEIIRRWSFSGLEYIKKEAYKNYKPKRNINIYNRTINQP
jgi:hypothetical protein